MYISSADLMERSFDRRVELAIEVKDQNSKIRFKKFSRLALKTTFNLIYLNLMELISEVSHLRGSKK